jgi:hypothetical protein
MKRVKMVVAHTALRAQWHTHPRTQTSTHALARTHTRARRPTHVCFSLKCYRAGGQAPEESEAKSLHMWAVVCGRVLLTAGEEARMLSQSR